MARRRKLYLTTLNIHKRQTSLFPAGLELAFAAGKRQSTYALNRVAIGIGIYLQITNKFSAVFQAIRETDTRKQD